jgi:hypothetical protein
VQLRVEPPDGSEPFDVLARVGRVDTLDDALMHGRMPGIGLELAFLAGDARERWAALNDQVLRCAEAGSGHDGYEALRCLEATQAPAAAGVTSVRESGPGIVDVSGVASVRESGPGIVDVSGVASVRESGPGIVDVSGVASVRESGPGIVDVSGVASVRESGPGTPAGRGGETGQESGPGTPAERGGESDQEEGPGDPAGSVTP